MPSDNDVTKIEIYREDVESLVNLLRLNVDRIPKRLEGFIRRMREAYSLVQPIPTDVTVHEIDMNDPRLNVEITENPYVIEYIITGPSGLLENITTRNLIRPVGLDPHLYRVADVSKVRTNGVWQNRVRASRRIGRPFPLEIPAPPESELFDIFEAHDLLGIPGIPQEALDRFHQRQEAQQAAAPQEEPASHPQEEASSEKPDTTPVYTIFDDEFF